MHNFAIGLGSRCSICHRADKQHFISQLYLSTERHKTVAFSRVSVCRQSATQLCDCRQSATEFASLFADRAQHNPVMRAERNAIVSLFEDRVKINVFSLVRAHVSCLCDSGQSATQLCLCLRSERNSILYLSADRTQMHCVSVCGKSATNLCLCGQSTTQLSLSVNRANTHLCLCRRTDLNSVVSQYAGRAQVNCL